MTNVLMQEMDPEQGCQLEYAQQMVVRLTQAMHQYHKDKVCETGSLCPVLCSCSGS